MKITAVSSNDYLSIQSNSKKSIEKKTEVSGKDRLEISSVGKSLSSYSNDGNFGVSEEKLQSIRSQVSAGTYNRDSKSVAQKLIDVMKGRIV